MKIVAAYRCIKPYMPAHRNLVGKFDWLEALRMLAASARARTGAEVFAITDQKLSVPSYRYVTTERKLMLWILEVSAMYLESDDFDQDTVFVSPDCLICGELNLFGGFDIGLVARDRKLITYPLLNGLQFWAVEARVKLGLFFREALRIARTLPAAAQAWGADTIPLVQLLGPIVVGEHERMGLHVKIFEPSIFYSVSTRDMAGDGHITPRGLVVDFRYYRKLLMAEFYHRAFVV